MSEKPDENSTDKNISQTEGQPSTDVAITPTEPVLKVIEDIEPEEDEHFKLLLKVEQEFLESSQKDQARVLDSRVKYNGQIRALVQENMTLTSVFLYVAELLDVHLPVTNIQPGKEIVTYKVRVLRDGSYRTEQLAHIAILIRQHLDRHLLQIREAEATRTRLEERVAAKDKELDIRAAKIQSLSITVKHPTISENPFVLAYLDKKGNFIYLGYKVSEKTGKPFDARVRDFSQAIKFKTVPDALIKLLFILKNRHNAFSTASRFRLYSANLMEIKVDSMPGPESLEKLREDAQAYERLMKVNKGKQDRADKKAKRKKLKVKSHKKSRHNADD